MLFKKSLINSIIFPLADFNVFFLWYFFFFTISQVLDFLSFLTSFFYTVFFPLYLWIYIFLATLQKMQSFLLNIVFLIFFLFFPLTVSAYHILGFLILPVISLNFLYFLPAVYILVISSGLIFSSVILSLPLPKFLFDPLIEFLIAICLFYHF